MSTATLTPLATALVDFAEQLCSQPAASAVASSFAGITLPLYDYRGQLSELPIATLSFATSPTSHPATKAICIGYPPDPAGHRRPFTTLAALTQALGAHPRKDINKPTRLWLVLGVVGLVVEVVKDDRDRVYQAICTKYPTPTDQKPTPPPPADSQATTRWLPYGVTAQVGSARVAGGGFYFGPHLASFNTFLGPEPSLVNPLLPVNFTHPDWRGDSLGYWPSYAALSPAGRAAYLAWLGSSRAAPQTPIGYVFLYFYGLERRVLTDLADPSDSLDYPAELLQLAAEVKRLQVVYGSDYVFARYAAGLQSVIQYMLEPTSSPTGPPPAVTANTWEFPLDISLGLARFAKAGQPIPPDWALAWVRANPDLYLRTPARRCPQLFAELFTIRYQRQYGAGLILDPARKLLNVPYRPASAGFRGVSVNPFGSLPDVRTQAAPNKALRDLTEQCTQALDPLSRYLGRHPGQVGSLPSIALLPAELILSRTADPALTLLNSWLETKLADRSEVLIAGTDLVGHWTPKIPGMLNKDEAQSQALLLTSLGFGIEPDIRYTGINPGSGPAVLFRQASLPPPPLPSKIAGAVLQLATVVSAPRALTAATLDEATNQIQRLLDLPADTRPRTHAKLRQTVASPPKLASAKRALAATDQNAREWIAALLIDLASAAGPPLPAQISALTKAYQALGLDPDAVYGHVHAHRPRPAASPVEIRPAGPSASGGAIPPPVFSQGNVILDPSVIAHTLAQSTQSAALLNRIFADDNAPTTQAPPPGPPCLDSAHTALLHALTARTLWSKAEVAELAVRHGLPVAGAIETLNEAAFEVCGDPVLEGDDQVEVNPAVLKELL